MGENLSLQQVMEDNKTIKNHVANNMKNELYYLLGVYPVELGTPLTDVIFQDAESIFKSNHEKNVLMESVYESIKRICLENRDFTCNFTCCAMDLEPEESLPSKIGSSIVGDIVYNAMDGNNKKAADVWATGGVDKAVEFMMTNPKTGQKWDYASMRAMYG
jgi:hypothetical protein